MGAKYLLLAIFICGCNGRERKTLIDWNLRGDVQSIKRQTFEGVRSNGEIIKGESTYGDNYVINFNKEGLVTDRTDFTLDGDIQTESIFKHNGNNLTEIKRYNSMGRIESIDTYFYKEGRLIKVESKDEFGDLIQSYTILANANNHVKEAKNFNERGTMIGSWKNEYKGQTLLKTSEYDTTGKLKGTTFYVYNSNKDIKEIHYRSSSSDFKRKYKYEYDKIGNWIKAEVYDENDDINELIIRRIEYYSSDRKNKLKASEFKGLWEEVEGNEWIDFGKDNKYEWGSYENIDDLGVYNYDAENSLITFNSSKEDNSKKYKVGYENGSLIFKSIKGKDQKIFQKQ